MSAVILLTSVISVSMFSVSAEEQNLDDIVLPYWENEFGDEIQLFASAEKIPSNITKDNFTLVKNTTKLPLTSLFAYNLPEGKETMNPAYSVSETIDPNNIKGAIFYVEIPDFGTVSHTYDVNATPENAEDDVTHSTNIFRFALNFNGYDYLRDAETGDYKYNEDGSIATKNKSFLTYGAPDWYIREVGTTEWKLSGAKTYYGIGLPSGWKGYVCIPFNALNQNNYNVNADSRITGVSIRQLRSTTDVFRADHNTDTPEYGYVPADKPLVISEPLWMTGKYTDGADEFYTKDSITIDGIAYDLNAGKSVDYSGNPTNLALGKAFKTYSATLDGAESPYANGKRSLVPSTSVLTSKQGTYMTGVRHYDSTIDAVTAPGRGYFPEGTLFSELTSNTNSGFLFHVDLPALDEGQSHRVTVVMAGTNSGGTANTRYLDIGAAGTSVFYFLKDGTTEWFSRTEGVDGEMFNNYQPIVSDGTAPWSGYVFVPKNAMNNWGTGIYNLQEVRVGVWVSRHSNKAPNTSDKHVRVSAVSMVNGFDPTTTVMYGDDNRIVDLATGEYLDLDYSKPAEFIGKTELINNGSATVLGLNNLPLKDAAIAGNAVSSSTATSGSLAAAAKFVKSTCAITGQPAINLKGDVTTARAQALQFDIPNVRAGDIDGFMFYVKTGEKPVSIGFNAATTITKEGGATASYYNNAYGYASTLPLLAKGATAWTTTKAQTPINGVSQIPANFEGYMYLPKFSSMSEVVGGLVDPDETLIWRLNFYIAAADDGNEETTDDMAVDFSFVPFTVANGTFTKNYAGKAFVNDSSVAQNMFSGDFVVPNDNDGDMRIDLLDLVRGKEEMSAAEFSSFRTTYLKYYLTENTDCMELNSAFAVKPFVYSSASDNILADNPDRGYRTEAVVLVKDGSPNPLYYYPLAAVNEPDGERVNGMSFNSEAEAQAWIDAQVATEDTLNLVYYQSTKTEVDTATANPADTYIIDSKTYEKGANKGKTLYYVYRVFESYEDANAYCYGEKILKGDNAYVVQGVTVNDKTYYRVKYDDRAVFTGWSESQQKSAYEYIYRVYFKQTDSGVNIDPSHVTLAYIYLTDWNGSTVTNLNGITEPLSEEALRTIEVYFETMRGHSAKSEVRFCYNGNVSRNWKLSDAPGGNSTQIYNDDWHAENCANQATIMKHVEQLAPVVAEYKQDIFNISCGFIGFVGEMANVYQYPEVDYADVQKAIVEQLCVPNDIYFSTRDPIYRETIMEKYPDWEYLGYVATNCDAFFGEQTNPGWSSGHFQKGNPENMDVDWWEYVTENAAYTPQGGEMYVQSAMIPDKVPSGIQAILQLAHHRYSTFSYWHGYLEGLSVEGNIMKGWMNEEITPEILDENGIAYDPAWFKEGETRNAYEFIRDHLGYRLSAQNTMINWNGKASGNINVTLNLKNYGFAAAFNLESGMVLLDSEGNVLQTVETGNPSEWYNLDPAYYTISHDYSTEKTAVNSVLNHAVSAQFDSIAQHGKYRVGFYLKNSAGNYVRLANDVEYENGYNIIGNVIVAAVNHRHRYEPANCGFPATCSCGDTKGEPTGVHTYYDGKCSVCEAPIDVTGTLGNVMIMGDSISTYHGYTYGQYGVLGQAWYGKEQDNTDLTGVHQTWWDILISNMDATLAYNRSCSGSTIAEATWANDTETKKYNSFNARLDEVLSHNELQMFGYTPEDIDTFIFFGGTNDNNRANIGEAKYSDWTAEDLKYFAPAYCRYIATVKANFPNAKIVSLVDTTLKQVADTQIAINEYYGITTVTINGFDEVAPHPTVKGMRQIEETLRYALSE